MAGIRMYGDSVLREWCAPVTEYSTERLRSLAVLLIDTMRSRNGAGLAAPQIGVTERVIAIDERVHMYKCDDVLVNPEILSRSEAQFSDTEGCLSLPGFRESVTRAQQVKVGYKTIEGEHKEIIARDCFARCLQHEIDHLDGKLFVDYLDPKRRKLIERQYVRSMARA